MKLISATTEGRNLLFENFKSIHISSDIVTPMAISVDQQNESG